MMTCDKPNPNELVVDKVNATVNGSPQMTLDESRIGPKPSKYAWEKRLLCQDGMMAICATNGSPSFLNRTYEYLPISKDDILTYDVLITRILDPGKFFDESDPSAAKTNGFSLRHGLTDRLGYDLEGAINKAWDAVVEHVKCSGIREAHTCFMESFFGIDFNEIINL